MYADFDNVKSLSKSAVCYGISRFITEISKVNRDDFLPKTLYEIVVCLQMHLKLLSLFWKLLDDTDKSFVSLKYTVDNIMKERASSAMCSITKQAKVLSYEDEELLWQK